MADRFIDTNLLIRLCTNDDPAKKEQVADLFLQVEEGTLTITAPDVVFAEAAYVLRSVYRLPRTEIAALLIPLVQLPNFKIDNREVVLRSLQIFANNNIDFADAMILASMEAVGATELYSYDTDFNRFPGIIRNPDTLT